MAGEWAEARFADLCEHSAFGPRFSSEEYAVDGNVACLRTMDVDSNGRIDLAAMPRAKLKLERFRNHILRSGDLVVTRTGAYLGKAAVFESFQLPVLPGAFSIRFRIKREIADPYFLRYYFNSVDGQRAISAIRTGSAQPNINIPNLHSLVIPLPPLAYQRSIVEVLRSLDDKIELNLRMNETLEAMAWALFKSWFVDFEPVRAKAEGRDPGLSQPLAELFPDSFEASELGEIPKGWAVVTLSELCSTQYGYTASAVDEPIGPKFLRVMDINKRNWIEWADVPHCAVEQSAREAYALEVGDLVVARMADPGKSAIIEEEVDAVFASYLVRLKTTSLANSYYVYGFLKSDLYAEYVAGAKSGSVQSNMNARVIVGASLVVPSLLITEHFLNAVLPVRKRLSASVRESRTLAALRDALLPKLIAGELRVKDAERLLTVASA